MDIQGLTPMGRWLYAGACVLLPVLWGLVIVWVTRRIERVVARRRPRSPESQNAAPELPTPEYHI